MDSRLGFQQDIRFARSAGDVRIAWSASGTGLPVVQVAHGLSHLEQDARAPLTLPWLTRLAARRRLVRYDHRGCGLSDRGVEDLSLAALVSDLEAVADAAHLERFALLGLASGGAVAISYAARHPERVSHLALVGTSGRGIRHLHAGETERRKWAALMTLVELAWEDADPTIVQMLLAQSFPNATLEELRSLAALQRHAANAADAVRMLRALADFDVSSELAHSRGPSLVLHARGDPHLPLDEGRAIAAAIPGARFATLESHNHLPLASEPAFEQLFAELERFLPAVLPIDAFAVLTQRERQILSLVATGLANAEIAAHLALSEKTARNNITHIFDKLGTASRPQAIVRARAAGLVADLRNYDFRRIDELPIRDQRPV